MQSLVPFETLRLFSAWPGRGWRIHAAVWHVATFGRSIRSSFWRRVYHYRPPQRHRGSLPKRQASPPGKEKGSKRVETAAAPISDAPEEQEWKQKLHAVLTESLSPASFERLVQRVLRESGFTQVEVTGRTGDGGIDGRGIARIHGLMSFHVLFQCKRYKGSVSAGEVRAFRGAMMGRADKGLFSTTGTFTPAAVKEATRDGAPPIDLLDGNEFAEKLKELSLGVLTQTVRVYTVDEAWFSNI